jgi:hypothetical protein
MAKKIIFCILDTSGLIAKNSSNLEPWTLFEFIKDQFLSLMKKYINSKQKRDLLNNIESLTSSKNSQLTKYFEFYLD